MFACSRFVSVSHSNNGVQNLNVGRTTRVPVIMEANGVDTPRIDKKNFLC